MQIWDWNKWTKRTVLLPLSGTFNFNLFHLNISLDIVKLCAKIGYNKSSSDKWVRLQRSGNAEWYYKNNNFSGRHIVSSTWNVGKMVYWFGVGQQMAPDSARICSGPHWGVRAQHAKSLRTATTACS